MSAAAPLAGVRVLEFARILAGPWAGQLLADLGATVIKVERPEVGDDTRAWGPPFVDRGGEKAAAYFHSTNRGKRSVTLNFEDPDDRAAAIALARGADVLIENFKIGGLARYGLDYPGLKAVNPRLVYCSVTGFGQTGPYAARAGYDFIVQGMGGIMELTGAPDGEPQKIGVAFADIFTGVYASTAILAALHGRAATGLGCHIDMALLDTQVAVLANQAMNYLVSGRSPSRLGNAHPNIVPYQVFAVADGHVIIATGNDGQYRRLCQLLGVAHLADDPRFRANADRVAHRDILVPLLSAEIGRQPQAALLAALEEAGIPAGPINRLDQVFADPQVVARAMRLDLSDSGGADIPGVRSPIVIDGAPAAAPGPSPALGEADRTVRDAIARGADPWEA